MAYALKKYELQAIYDSRKSFYGKAHVIEYEDGSKALQSYNTIVSRCDNGVVIHLGNWSMTTTRHQREFEKQFKTKDRYEVDEDLDDARFEDEF